MILTCSWRMKKQNNSRILCLSEWPDHLSGTNCCNQAGDTSDSLYHCQCGSADQEHWGAGGGKSRDSATTLLWAELSAMCQLLVLSVELQSVSQSDAAHVSDHVSDHVRDHDEVVAALTSFSSFTTQFLMMDHYQHLDPGQQGCKN